jgi:ATP-binding cassette subfamily F protein uup
LGPNGSGKSTLLKILMQNEDADEGHITRRKGLRIGYASQFPEFPSISVEDVLLREHPPAESEIDGPTKARILLGKAQFTDFSQDASLLSGGWKKRLDIVRALMQEPDLLLLDEPTNHLDLEGIFWLEKFLTRERTPYLVVSHDRYFLEQVANKVIELNRCFPNGLFISDGNMSSFMEHKEAFLLAQERLAQGLANVVRDETEWLKRSPKARTKKSRSRIQQTYELIEELSSVTKRNTTYKVDIDFLASERETRKLLVAKNLSKSLSGRQLFKGVDLILSPGSRLGIVGKNGTGKTTLMKVLAGMIPQDLGTIKYATDIRIAYFDQLREHLPPDITLREALSPTGDTVTFRGQPIHVHGWAKKFLFSTDRLSLPVKCLSGGERARILIARLMLQPADLLFLDEPTNDLDIPTLEVIEESLKNFAGAVVLISHDRCLMDRICTQILGLGTNTEQHSFADYQQWERTITTPLKKEPEQKAPPLPAPQRKLSFKEQKELEGMTDSIQAIEVEIEKLQQQLTSADPASSLPLYQALGELQKKLDFMFERWDFLEKKVASFSQTNPE